MLKFSDSSLKPEYQNLPEGDVKLSQAEILMAKNHFSWEPKITLEEGLKELLTIKE